jgi:hypothetical protein
VVVDGRKAQVLEGEAAQASYALLDREAALAEALQEVS